MADLNEEEEKTQFLHKRHVHYSLKTLDLVPCMYQSFDSTRLVVAFFAISTLDLLKSLSQVEDIKSKIIDWIYHLQVEPSETEPEEKCGFRGSVPCTVFSSDVSCTEYFDKPHIAMTYSALALLLILGDDLSRVKRKAIIRSLKKLQLENGSFCSVYSGSESDMRFIYCACCISYILDDFSGIDVDRTFDYIQKSITYEGGIAQGPHLEAHGGSTFCAVASLWMMGKLNLLSDEQLHRLKRWCVFRQIDGFQGRPNKPTDTCYSFWVGSTLKLLDSYHFVDQPLLRKYILSAQELYLGGIGKYVGNDLCAPDPLHTFLAISGLSLMQYDDLLSIHPALNISQRAADFLDELHRKWSAEKQ